MTENYVCFNGDDDLLGTRRAKIVGIHVNPETNRCKFTFYLEAKNCYLTHFWVKSNSPNSIFARVIEKLNGGLPEGNFNLQSLVYKRCMIDISRENGYTNVKINKLLKPEQAELLNIKEY